LWRLINLYLEANYGRQKDHAEELLEAKDFDLEDMAQKVADAINNATPGAIIAESEEPVRDADAESMMALASVYYSGQWNSYWKQLRKAA